MPVIKKKASKFIAFFFIKQSWTFYVESEYNGFKDTLNLAGFS